MDYERPRISLKKTSLDILLERLALVILILMWVDVIVSYSSLPQIIPSHFDFKGRPNDYADKAVIFLMPVIGTVLFAGLRFLNRYPFIFNYPIRITKENAEKQYTLSTRMLRVINLVIVAAFSYITVKIIYDAKQGTSVLDWWFIPVLMLGLLVPTGYYVWKSFKK